jgi:hypothetical protein
MFWSRKRSGGSPQRIKQARQKHARRLLVESLESRDLLAGLVDVQIFPLLAPGELDLVGDGSNNQVEISQTLNPGEYRIDGVGDTLLQLNGAGVTMPSVTVNGIFGNIEVDLRDGDDTFTFSDKYAASGQPSSVPMNLQIINSDGSNVNTITDVLINANLDVIKAGGSSGYSELHIVNTTVIGYTTVDNTGGGSGGDSWTEIDNSWLQGNGAAGPALLLVNPDGKDINDVLGNSQFGIGPFPQPGPVVLIDNGAGGSRTTFTGASPVAGFGTTTIYGDLLIINGTNVPGTLDTVTFNGSNVLGDVQNINGDGNTSVTVTNSTLGSHLVAPPFSPVIGSPVEILNDAGFDQFLMTNSSAPWGVYINNDVSGNNDVWGSATEIMQSEVGTAPFGPDIPGFPNTALVLMGDNGADVVNVSATRLGGTLDLNLFNGNNSVNLTNASSMPGLQLVTGSGNDNILIDNSAILVAVYVRLGSGADRFIVNNVDPATEWPSGLLGLVDIHGELGVDTTNVAALALGALGFEIFV